MILGIHYSYFFVAKISLLGAVSALFEASMYSFVFMWSPILISAAKEYGLGDLPFGMIFACFMVCIMIGSSLFSIGMQRGISCHSMLRIALILGVVSLSVPLWAGMYCRVFGVCFFFVFLLSLNNNKMQQQQKKKRIYNL